MLLNITKYKGFQDKRFSAHFENGRIVHFGQKNPKIGTYIDHFDDKIKMNYIKRHEVRENWDNPMQRGLYQDIFCGTNHIQTSMMQSKIIITDFFK